MHCLLLLGRSLWCHFSYITYAASSSRSYCYGTLRQDKSYKSFVNMVWTNRTTPGKWILILLSYILYYILPKVVGIYHHIIGYQKTLRAANVSNRLRPPCRNIWLANHHYVSDNQKLILYSLPLLWTWRMLLRAGFRRSFTVNETWMSPHAV